MIQSYSQVLNATEEMLRAIYAHAAPLPVKEILVRDQIAKAALLAWYTNTKPMVDALTHELEYDRLEGLRSDFSDVIISIE